MSGENTMWPKWQLEEKLDEYDTAKAAKLQT